jgi:hypothetical protein
VNLLFFWQETIRQFEFLSIKRRVERAKFNFESHCDDLLKKEEEIGKKLEDDAGDKVTMSEY